MPKQIKPELRRILELHVRISPSEKKIVDKKSKGYRSVADYIREKILN